MEISSAAGRLVHAHPVILNSVLTSSQLTDAVTVNVINHLLFCTLHMVLYSPPSVASNRVIIKRTSAATGPVAALYKEPLHGEGAPEKRKKYRRRVNINLKKEKVF